MQRYINHQENFEWTWNSTCQNLCDMAKDIIKENTTMAAYNEKNRYM